MIHWTCNYRSYNCTTQSESAGRWEGRRVLPRCRRQWPRWGRWRQSPPCSVLILLFSLSGISPQPGRRRRRRRKWRWSLVVLLVAGSISGGELVMTDRRDGLCLLPHLHQLPSQCNQTSSLGTRQSPLNIYIHYTVLGPNQAGINQCMDMKVSQIN